MRVFLCIVIAALLALTIYLWRNKNTQETCDCSAAIDEGYDLGVVDGLNALDDEPAIETYGNMDEETSYDCLYRPRETPDGGATWKCRDGWKDTGLNWGDPDGGVRQCMQCKGAYPDLKGVTLHQQHLQQYARQGSFIMDRNVSRHQVLLENLLRKSFWKNAKQKPRQRS